MFLSALSRIFCTTPAGAATGPAITEQPALEGTSADHLVQPPAGQDHAEITHRNIQGPGRDARAAGEGFLHIVGEEGLAVKHIAAPSFSSAWHKAQHCEVDPPWQITSQGQCL